MIPAGLEVTSPVPVPLTVTVSVTAGPKVATVDITLVRLSVQTAVDPAQAPVHDENAEPVAGVAVRTTVVPLTYASAQSPGHAMPVGFDATLPEPLVPTVSV